MIILLFNFTFKAISQPLLPSVQLNTKTLDNGYYFLYPYKIPKSLDAQQILDAKGRVIAYNLINAASDFKLHHNGMISYFANGKHIIMNQSFKIIDSISCVNGIETDRHDFIILPNGHYLLIGMETITEDFSNKYCFLKKGINGSKNAKVKYGVVQELDRNKNVVFQWSSKGTYLPEDADPFYLTDTANIDLTHFNSVDINKKGEILVSVRFFNEVIKINKHDSSVIWRMGGRKNQILVTNDSLPFYGQHDARYIDNNRFTLFDNGYSFDSLKHNVRALEYMINDKSKTAKVIWKYSNENQLISEATGNVQRLENGNTLIHYGYLGKGIPKISFEVVKGNREKIFQSKYNEPIASYRVYFYKKNKLNLHRPKLTKKRENGIININAPIGYKYYLWNTGQTSPKISATNRGEYYVYLSNDSISFIASKILKLNK